jgi:hypothetical protein
VHDHQRLAAARKDRITSMMVCLLSASMPWSGSSRKYSSASCTSARARKARWRSPPESSPIWRFGEVGERGALERRPAPRPLGRAGTPEPAERSVGPHHHHVEDGGRGSPSRRRCVAGCSRCGAAPRRACRPKKRTEPGVGGHEPEHALSCSVLLPAPLGPTIAMMTPLGTSKSTSLSTSASRYPTDRQRASQALVQAALGEDHSAPSAATMASTLWRKVPRYVSSGGASPSESE